MIELLKVAGLVILLIAGWSLFWSLVAAGLQGGPPRRR